MADLLGRGRRGGVVGHGREGRGRGGDRQGWGRGEGRHAGGVARGRVGDGGVLELLDYGANVVGVVLARRRAGLVEDLALGRGDDTADAVDEAEGVLLGPEVDVERVQPVVVLALVVGVVCGQVPLLLALDVADGQGDDAGLLVRVAEVGGVEVCRSQF